MTRNSRRLQKAVQAIFNDYREKASCPGQVYQNAACGCDNALQMWRGPKGEKGDTGPQGPKGDNAGSFLVDAEFVVDPEGQEPGAYLKLVLIDVAQQEQVVYVDLSYLTDIYEGGNGISIVDMVVAARLGAGLTFDANGNIASAYQFCDGLDETSNVVKVRLDSANRILGFASGTCGGLTATVGLAPSATGVNLVLTGAGGTVLSTVPLEGGAGITVQKNAQTGGFTWLADPAGLVSSQTGNQLSVSQTDNKLYVGGNTLEYTFGTGAFTLKDSSGATLSSVTVPSTVRMLEGMELRTDGGIYLHLTYLRDNGLHAYQDVSLDELLCNNVDTADDTAAAYSKAVPSGNWQTASINEIGGRTVVWNQLLTVLNSSQSKTLNGASLVDNRDGTYTVSTEAGGATADAAFTFTQTVANLQAGHKYLYRCTPAGGSTTTYYAYLVNNSIISYTRDVGNGCFYTATGSGIVWEVIFVASGTVITTPLVFNPRLIDLTLMFGAGNEPASVAEFEAMFPAEYYAYDAGTLKSAGVTEVVSDGENVMPPPAAGTITVNGITAVSDGSGTVTISGTTSSTVSLRFDVPEFTIPISGGLGGSHQFFVNNSFASGVISIVFYYNNIQIDSWSLASQYRTTRNYTAMGGRLCNNWRVNIYAADTTVDGTIAPVFINDTSSATARYNFKEYLHATLPIPAAVQALPGYGWSAGTAYNYIDYARKVYVQRVGSVDLGTLTWQINDSYTRPFFVSPLGSKVLTLNLLCEKGYVASDFATLLANDFHICSIANSIRITDSNYSTPASFKAAMQGVMLQYELAEPIETDISSLLTGDNLINVEAGGTLTFKNQHGDDWRVPVPNSETFIYEHPWVFEDCVKDAMQPAIDALNARIDDVSVELTLDAHCEDVVTPATAEPFDDYLLDGSINTLLLESDGTISDLKHTNPIPVDNTARGSFTMELFNPENTDGLSIELYARSYIGSDGHNDYSNIDSEADSQKCATLADFLAAGEQGLPLPYVGESSLSGVRHFAENETLYASVVSNGNNSYTFTFTVRTPEVVEQEPVLDLVSGENRTDLKPLLEHVGGKVTVPTLQKVTYWVTSDDVTPPYYAAADFDWAFLNENGQLVRPSYHEVSDDYLSLTFMFYDTIPVSFDFGDYCGAAFTLVGGYTSQSPKAYANIKAIDASAQGSPYEMATTTLAEAYAAGDAGIPFYRVIMDDDTGEPVSVDLNDSIRVRFSLVSNDSGDFKVEVLNSAKTTLCLEPSCDPCIDLSPVMDAVDEMIDDALTPVQEQVTQNASDIDALETKTDITNKDVANIQALLNGTLYREETDSTAAYSKAVPSSAMPWASVDMIGGRTVVWNQLFNETNVAGIYTSISHNSETHSYDITVSETSSTTYCGLLYNYSGSNLKGHKILNVVTLSNPNFVNTPLGVQFMQRGESQNTGSITINYNGAGVYSGISDVSVNATYIYCYMKFNSITANDSFTFSKWQIFDLTAMFGAGNEPSTVAEFEAIFPAAYYAYDAGTLKSAAVTQVVSEGKNLFDITTLDGVSGLTINGNEFSIIYSLNLFSKNIFVNDGKRTGPMTITGEMFYHSASLVGLTVNVQYTDNSTVSSIVAERNQWGAIPTITTDPAKVVKRVFFSYASSNVQTDVRNLQVEWGTSATAYAPYRAPISYPVPSQIQALPGYGWSAGTVYNYVDYERKVYVQRVGSVDLGTLNWVKSTGTNWRFSVNSANAIGAKAPQVSQIANAVCSRYQAATENQTYLHSYDKIFSIGSSGSLAVIRVYDTQYENTDAATFKTAMSGVLLYYELATLIETDISQYLSDDNLINVEAGGTLTFKNQNGDDWRVPVPNSETYIIDIQEAVSNG